MSVIENMSVSVCIPTYNGGEYLREAIESALAQTRPPDEIIVVDDGSPRPARALCESFGAKVCYIYQQNDGSMGAGARAHAMREARGDWLALLDHDDRWLPDKLEKQLRAAEAHPEAGAVFTEYVAIDETGRAVERDSGGELTGGVRFIPAAEAFHLLLTCNPFCPSSAIVSRGAAQAHLRTDQTVVGCGDWELWFSVARHYPVVVLDEPLTEYRVSLSQFCADKHQLALRMRQTLEPQRARFHSGCAACAESYQTGTEHVSDVFAVAARNYLDQYHAVARAGRVSDAMTYLRGAVRAAPREVLSPRRAAAVLKTLALGVKGGAKRTTDEPV